MNDPEPAPPAGPEPTGQRRARAPLRQCALSRQELPAEAMLRFIAGPDGAIAPDVTGRLGGRGVWVTATRTAVAEAARRNVFAKSLKQNAKPPIDLADQVDRHLVAHLRQALSFANKAGLVTAGFAKVEDALERGRVAVLVQASDAAEDGSERLWRKFAAIAGAQGRTPCRSRLLTGVDLSLAIGRSHVIHAALAEGGQSRAFLRESLRLERFRLNDETTTDVGATAPAAATEMVPGPEVGGPDGQD